MNLEKNAIGQLYRSLRCFSLKKKWKPLPLRRLSPWEHVSQYCPRYCSPRQLLRLLRCSPLRQRWILILKVLRISIYLTHQRWIFYLRGLLNFQPWSLPVQWIQVWLCDGLPSLTAHEVPSLTADLRLPSDEVTAHEVPNLKVRFYFTNTNKWKPIYQLKIVVTIMINIALGSPSYVAEHLVINIWRLTSGSHFLI